MFLETHEKRSVRHSESELVEILWVRIRSVFDEVTQGLLTGDLGIKIKCR